LAYTAGIFVKLRSQLSEKVSVWGGIFLWCFYIFFIAW